MPVDKEFLEWDDLPVFNPQKHRIAYAQAATGPWQTGEPPKDGTKILGRWSDKTCVASWRIENGFGYWRMELPGFTHCTINKNPDRFAIINK